METLQRTANRGSVSTATTYEVANSCKFEKDNSERLQRAYGNIGTPTNADKFTLSIWLKRTELQPSGEDIFFCGNAGAVTICGMVTFWFSSTDIAGVVPTADPKPITKSSAESSRPT